ncbi:TIGR00282 family metallophosphoesterase [Nisaea acidiphila]|uniref:TIGR00282 family metallophosphoesterase n=1 Tax=Nisaea acidiphila TaxID=1862145 RepID=A0A9J7AY47_9PROT|nr:TIGR00282 family metallophosphoesterase [Nisaea acidiphila]UUX51722.1 TIGR00282 family metallophosphoesterase [Nisaea acidiphila]
MRVLFLGDVVGRAGREAVHDRLPELRERLSVDFAIVNGENAAGGFGITPDIAEALFDAGADVITTGNHAFDKREILTYFDAEPRLLRPANFPPETNGKGSGLYPTRDGRHVLVANVILRLFMDTSDCPFRAAEKIVEECPLGYGADFIFIDMHGEATSEKLALGHFLDGRASAVVGTHTHVPTADHMVLPGGTAYMTDAGMCGAYDSVIGMNKEAPVERFLSKTARPRLEAADGPATVSGLLVISDDATGLATHAEPVRLGGLLSETQPDC